jgi:hypothetical protein
MHIGWKSGLRVITHLPGKSLPGKESNLISSERNNAKRRELVSICCRKLAGLPSWVTPFEACSGNGAYHLMVALASDETVRSRFLAALKEPRVQTSLDYSCVPDFSALGHFARMSLEKSRASRGARLRGHCIRACPPRRSRKSCDRCEMRPLANRRGNLE